MPICIKHLYTLYIDEIHNGINEVVTLYFPTDIEELLVIQ